MIHSATTNHICSLPQTMESQQDESSSSSSSRRWTCDACGCNTNSLVENPLSCSICGSSRQSESPRFEENSRFSFSCQVSSRLMMIRSQLQQPSGNLKIPKKSSTIELFPLFVKKKGSWPPPFRPSSKVFSLHSCYEA